MMELYEEMRKEAENRISVYSSQWHNFLPSDPGMTILEILTWQQAGQRQKFQEFPEEASENLLKLMGFVPQKEQGTVLYVEAKDRADCMYIPENQKFYAGELCFETEKTTGRFCGKLLGIYRLQGQKPEEILELKEGVPLHTEIFSSKPKKGMTVYLLFDELPATEGKADLLLYVMVHQEMPRNPSVPPGVFAEISFEYYNGSRFEEAVCEDDTCGFLENGEIRIKFVKERAKTVCFAGKKGYLLRCILRMAEYDIPPSVVSISGPLLRLRQQDTKILTKEGALALCDAKVEPYRKLGVLYGYDRQEFGMEPFGAVEEKSLRVMAEGCSLEFAAGDDRLLYEYDRKRKVLRVLKAGAYEGRTVYISRLSVTEGSLGNIRRQNELRCTLEGKTKLFQNLEAGFGGRDEETLEELKKRFVRDLRTPVCAVTLGDYESLAKETPGLCIHKARAYYDCESACTKITVLPYGREEYPRLSRIYQREILAYLEDRRLLNSKIELKSPVYVKISVHVIVRQSTRRREENKEAQIRKLLLELLDDRKNDRQLGTTISYAGIYEKIGTLPGVQKVCALTFHLEGGAQDRLTKGEDIELLPYMAAVPGKITIDLNG